MAAHPHELPPPAQAWGDDSASELLRAWIVDRGLQLSLRRGFDEPSVWGILLVDLARHAARIYATEEACTEDQTLDAIKAMFEAEWDRPTDPGTTLAQQ